MRKLTITILLSLLVILAGCGNQITGSAVEEPITIGSILILTGPGAAWGIAERNGIELAIDEINADGGINGRPLRAIHEDDQSEATKSISAFRKLTEFDDVDVIIGTTWSHTGIPLIEMADEGEVLMISPSLGMADFNEGSEFLFNTWPHDFILSEHLAEHVFEKGHRSVAVIGAQQIWVKEQTNSFVRRFEQLGGTVEVLVEPLPDNHDVLTDALKIKARADEIDAVVSTTDGVPIGALVAKQMRTLGVDLPMFSITIDEDTLESAQGAYEGMQFLTFLTPSDEFVQMYEERFGMSVDIGADSAFDATMLIARAMRETGSTDANVLQEFLNSIEIFEGASGTLVSDGEGGFIKDFVTIEVQDGEMVQI